MCVQMEKPQIHLCIAMIALIAVLVTAGCLGPAGTAVNATPEPTPEPCETCSVPEGFCGPYGVCPGEPVNGIYVFTDRNVYLIGEVVEFGIVNCGDEPVGFGSPLPWWIDNWVTNTSGCTPGNCTGGTWEPIADGGCAPAVMCFLDPGENWTVQWNTTNWWDTAEASGSPVHPYDIRISDDPLIPGIYRVRYEPNFTKVFEFV